MKVLVVGSKGRVGRQLIRCSPPGAMVIGLNRAELDVTDRRAVARSVDRVRPDLIFNAAGFTAVDVAEHRPEAAFATNASAVSHLAEAAGSVGARLVHLSTDFVFAGDRATPYPPDAPAAPLNIYGHSKLAGERMAGPDALIVRTAWLYAPAGTNFVQTLLGMLARMQAIEVVKDQVGTPTYVPDLALALWKLAIAGATGLYHFTDEGACSRHEFATAIQEEAIAAGLLRRRVPIAAVPSSRYPTPARRPHYSVLDNSATFALLGEASRSWRSNLRRMIGHMRNMHG